MRNICVLVIGFLLLLFSACSIPGGIPVASSDIPAITPSLPPAATTSEPALAPTDGTPSGPCKKIALIIIDGANSDLHTVCPDGSSLTNLTNDWSLDTHPAWSADGKWIAYASNITGNSQIHIMNENGMFPQQITSDHINDMPVWLPDGQKVAFRTTDSNGFWWWRIADVVTHQVTDYSKASYDFFFQTPAWSPDNGYLAYMSLVEQAARNDGSSQIHVVNLADSSDVALTADTWANIHPKWSKDGKQLAFLSERDGTYNTFALYIMNRDGSGVQRVTEPVFSESAVFSWSPDGTQIVLGDTWVPATVYLIDIASGEMKILLDLHDGLQPASPDWQP